MHSSVEARLNTKRWYSFESTSLPLYVIKYTYTNSNIILNIKCPKGIKGFVVASSMYINTYMVGHFLNGLLHFYIFRNVYSIRMDPATQLRYSDCV